MKGLPQSAGKRWSNSTDCVCVCVCVCVFSRCLSARLQQKPSAVRSDPLSMESSKSPRSSKHHHSRSRSRSRDRKRQYAILIVCIIYCSLNLHLGHLADVHSKRITISAYVRINRNNNSRMVIETSAKHLQHLLLFNTVYVGNTIQCDLVIVIL